MPITPTTCQIGSRSLDRIDLIGCALWWPSKSKMHVAKEKSVKGEVLSVKTT